MVKEIIKAVDRGEGLLDSTAALRRALDEAGSGAMSIRINDDCQTTSLISDVSLKGCKAIAIAVLGGNEDSADLSGVAVFNSERRAEAGVEDIEDAIEDNDRIDADIDEIKFDSDIVTFKVTRYE